MPSKTKRGYHCFRPNFFLRFSPPEQLHSDQGRQFESSLLREVCRSLGIHKTRTTPYHPQGDGLVERFNRTLLNMLGTTAEDHPATWETLLPKLCIAYNTSIQASTGYTVVKLDSQSTSCSVHHPQTPPHPTNIRPSCRSLSVKLTKGYEQISQLHTIARKSTTTNASMAGPFSQVILFGYSQQQFQLGILANFIVHGRYKVLQKLTRSSPATANLASTLCILAMPTRHAFAGRRLTPTAK